MRDQPDRWRVVAAGGGAGDQPSPAQPPADARPVVDVGRQRGGRDLCHLERDPVAAVGHRHHRDRLQGGHDRGRAGAGGARGVRGPKRPADDPPRDRAARDLPRGAGGPATLDHLNLNRSSSK